MFQPQEVEEIYKVARELTGDTPSSSILERLAQVANEPDTTVECLCMEIDVLAAAGKLARGNEEEVRQRNQRRAEALQALMRLLRDKDQTSKGKIRSRRRRASALHTISKLRRSA